MQFDGYMDLQNLCSIIKVFQSSRRCNQREGRIPGIWNNGNQTQMNVIKYYLKDYTYNTMTNKIVDIIFCCCNTLSKYNRI